jgi:hypothetical protein
VKVPAISTSYVSVRIGESMERIVRRLQKAPDVKYVVIVRPKASEGKPNYYVMKQREFVLRFLGRSSVKRRRPTLFRGLFRPDLREVDRAPTYIANRAVRTWKPEYDGGAWRAARYPVSIDHGNPAGVWEPVRKVHPKPRARPSKPRHARRGDRGSLWRAVAAAPKKRPPRKRTRRGTLSKTGRMQASPIRKAAPKKSRPKVKKKAAKKASPKLRSRGNKTGTRKLPANPTRVGRNPRPARHGPGRPATPAPRAPKGRPSVRRPAKQRPILRGIAGNVDSFGTDATRDALIELLTAKEVAIALADGPRPDSEEPATETLFPEIKPSDLHPLSGAPFTVAVLLSSKAAADTSGEIEIPAAAPDVVRTLRVHLLCDGYSGWDTLEYSGAAGTTKPARFGLSAPNVEGDERRIAMLRANFYLDNRWCGEGARNLDIRRDAAVDPIVKIPKPDMPAWRKALRLEPGATPPDLIVRIQGTTGSGEYVWSCLSPHLTLPAPVDLKAATMSLGTDAETYVRNLFKPYASIPLGRLAIAQIEGVGQGIYRSTPDIFKDAYWAVWKAATEGHFAFDTVQIVTDEPYIPWELMRIADRDRGPEVAPEFLAIRHSVGRWLASKSSRLTQRVRVNATAVAASDYSTVAAVAQKLPWAALEKNFLVERFETAPVELKSGPVLDFLEGGQAQAVHFACHGRMSITNPLASQLILEDTPDDLQPPMIDRDEVRDKGLGRMHPLVFLNACEVGGAAASLSLVAGFPAAFLGAGAAAVISPLWVVNDERAKQIAELFYEQAFAEDPVALGDVLRKVRARWRDEKHLTYLAYVLYGDPLAKVIYTGPRSAHN